MTFDLDKFLLHATTYVSHRDRSEVTISKELFNKAPNTLRNLLSGKHSAGFDTLLKARAILDDIIAGDEVLAAKIKLVEAVAAQEKAEQATALAVQGAA